MKILHITSSDSNGAGIAAQRILEAESELGHHVNMIVRDKSRNNNKVHKFYYFKYLDYLINIILRFFGLDYMFSFNGLKIINSKLFKEADIIHIHNIHHTRMMFPTQLPKNKKYVYTLHDMWALTGFCNYTYDLCDKYTIGCGNCYQQKDDIIYTYKKMLIDRTSYHWKIKKKTFEKLDIIFTSPSNWLSDLAKKSPITNSKGIYVIPNCIKYDNDIEPKKSFDESKNLKLLFVGQKSNNNNRKGFNYVLELCNILDFPHEIIIVGENDSEIKDLFINKNTNVSLKGSLNYEDLKKNYEFSDILLLPSLQDNFPNTILESFSSGTPVIAFNTGGIKDLVNEKTGYLAKFKSTNDLKEGVHYVKNNLKELSEYILVNNKKYDYSNIGKMFEQLYIKHLNN
jgi:glycosyltransferase involved in cell wall biosynthesis